METVKHWLPVSDEILLRITLFLSKLGISLLIFLGFWMASLILKRVICRFEKKADTMQRDVLELVGQIVKIGLLILGAITALGTAGVNISALVAGLGLTGFALGFAFRDALSNLLAGILIMIYHPFYRSDFISVAGCDGTVIKIDLRYTTLQGADRIFLIPNATLFTNTIGLVKTRPPWATDAIHSPASPGA